MEGGVATAAPPLPPLGGTEGGDDGGNPPSVREKEGKANGAAEAAEAAAGQTQASRSTDEWASAAPVAALPRADSEPPAEQAAVQEARAGAQGAQGAQAQAQAQAQVQAGAVDKQASTEGSLVGVAAIGAVVSAMDSLEVSASTPAAPPAAHQTLSPPQPRSPPREERSRLSIGGNGDGSATALASPSPPSPPPRVLAPPPPHTAQAAAASPARGSPKAQMSPPPPPGRPDSPVVSSPAVSAPASPAAPPRASPGGPPLGYEHTSLGSTVHLPTRVASPTALAGANGYTSATVPHRTSSSGPAERGSPLARSSHGHSPPYHAVPHHMHPIDTHSDPLVASSGLGGGAHHPVGSAAAAAAIAGHGQHPAQSLFYYDHVSTGDGHGHGPPGDFDAAYYGTGAPGGTHDTHPAGFPEPALAGVQRVIQCPPAIVGRIIGKGGETIRLIQAKHAVHVDIRQQGLPAGEPRPITITGSAQAVERAANEVETLIDSAPFGGMPHATPGAAVRAKTIACPRERIAQVIGRAGATIRRLEDASGARLQLDQHASPGPTITISSTDEKCVNTAERMLQDMFAHSTGPEHPHRHLAHHYAAGGVGMGMDARGGYGAPHGRSSLVPSLSLPVGGFHATMASMDGNGAGATRRASSLYHPSQGVPLSAPAAARGGGGGVLPMPMPAPHHSRVAPPPGLHPLRSVGSGSYLHVPATPPPPAHRLQGISRSRSAHGYGGTAEFWAREDGSLHSPEERDSPPPFAAAQSAYYYPPGALGRTAKEGAGVGPLGRRDDLRADGSAINPGGAVTAHSGYAPDGYAPYGRADDGSWGR